MHVWNTRTKTNWNVCTDMKKADRRERFFHVKKASSDHAMTWRVKSSFSRNALRNLSKSVSFEAFNVLLLYVYVLLGNPPDWKVPPFISCLTSVWGLWHCVLFLGLALATIYQVNCFGRFLTNKHMNESYRRECFVGVEAPMLVNRQR